MTAGAPAGCTMTASFAAHGRLRHELYINRATVEECKALFDHLEAQRAEFDAAYGPGLVWERIDGKKACRIAEYRYGRIENLDEHGEYLDWFISAGDRLRKALAAVTIS